jgi:hypothetical protein
MSERRESGADNRVRVALKTAIEVVLARERADPAAFPAVSFTEGVFFSRVHDGTFFHNGVIFGREFPRPSDIRLAIPADEAAANSAILQQLSEFDDAAFNAFTERLLRLKQVKGDRGQRPPG